jgi:hypothetical protein
MYYILKKKNQTKIRVHVTSMKVDNIVFIQRFGNVSSRIDMSIFKPMNDEVLHAKNICN